MLQLSRALFEYIFFPVITIIYYVILFIYDASMKYSIVDRTVNSQTEQSSSSDQLPPPRPTANSANTPVAQYIIIIIV